LYFWLAPPLPQSPFPRLIPNLLRALKGSDPPKATEEPSVEIPPEIPEIFRIGPGMLILGSYCIVTTLMVLSQALRWGNFREGLIVESMMLAFLSIPLAVLLGGFQGVLAILFMSKKRRAWWRSTLVILPSLVLVADLLFAMISLFPHEKRARNELEHHLGGPVPASLRNVTLDFSGGIDPKWIFHFEISPEDFEILTTYRDYGRSMGSPLHHHDESHGQFYYLDYDPATRLCKFQSIDY
jgi:hypothetical protein